mmetsp:Transcript_8730/g.27848  ORF Transcript_8730/g.27848 Transcript_8730/m.27848 type:complete len:131 (+) Transcript_8730:107-499(+)
MCKHIKNAQVSVRAPCCNGWFDCVQCHDAVADHPLAKRFELIIGCKKCKKVFRKDLREMEADESDEYCPYCDNHYVIEADTGDEAKAPPPPPGAEEVQLELDPEYLDVRGPKSKGLQDAMQAAVAEAMKK